MGLGNMVLDGAISLSARTSYYANDLLYKFSMTSVNKLSYFASSRFLGYSGQKILMTHGKQYVDYGRFILKEPLNIYTPQNLNIIYSRYSDFKRVKNIISK
ncbi:hypothetical protein [Psychroflexus halocasei]|nr:hypothetical protein [Psychroflexus halocasei]